MIHAADGYARSTGKAGVCLVTSGPGATNLVTGITRSICKYAVTVRRREELAETIKKAFIIAGTGKPGVVDLPKDIQRTYGSDAYPKEVVIRGYKPQSFVHMG